MIELSPQVVTRIQQQLAKRGSGIGVHIDVIRSGCSGYSYRIDFVDEVGEAQQQFAHDGFVVVVDDEDVALLDGLELRLEQKGLNSAFAFNNPQANGTCGCGTSFSV
ncbi:iron-sulfur cluster assembly accessory protein [Suttonella sp. R2A3]|uniref:HesB/IscA family protein n=1 Tax=Suttonella sp. R2A3 TaxID=2908648 RepID=UPI001F22E53C|nr:iron-sulfur cluster assembly accessory protein [Suttonella sp. R2A3]UJF25276.1 iron-sulfur cluster assembly accessory protein [Suttonella sp. R2A3]